MSHRRAKRIRKELFADGVEITSEQGRNVYRKAKRAAAPPVVASQFVKPLPASHSHRTEEARAHAARTVRVTPGWRVNAPLISAKHPQRARRSGKGKLSAFTPTPALPPIFGLRKFAGAFMAAAMSVTAGVAKRYAKRAPRSN